MTNNIVRTTITFNDIYKKFVVTIFFTQGKIESPGLATLEDAEIYLKKEILKY